MTPDTLSANAKMARENAYCPYSGYAVGCAIESQSGEVFVGCNIENISYGLTICAERAAVSQMVSSGQREIVSVLVLTRDGGTPCGMCLQTIAEFAPNLDLLAVYTEDEKGRRAVYALRDLLPHGFTSKLVLSHPDQM